MNFADVFAVCISMGIGIHGETQEEIERIQIQADPTYEPDDEATPAAATGGEAAAAAAAAVGGEENPTKKTRKTTSDVWKHFTRGPVQSNGSYYGTCNYCGEKYLQGQQRGTSSMRNHIDKKCKKFPRNKPEALQKLLQAKSERDVLVAWRFDQMKCRKGLAKMVIAHEYPFNCVNHYFFRDFLNELQPAFKIPSRTTLRADCMKIYEEEQVNLYEMFGNLSCRFSFTSDLWTNKGRDRGFMAITCHYIDEGWILRKRILTFVPLPSPHTGRHIASAIYDKLCLWNLDKRVFSLVLDNASSNDACISELLYSTTIKDDLPVEGKIFHQRCGCHILNLIVQDGLNTLHKEIDCIRETMKWIKHSQGRIEKFKLACSQMNIPYKKPQWDVPTRWNSTYLMLELALELKPAIVRYASLDKKFSKALSDSQWGILNELVKHLKVFYEATLKLSGTKYPTLNLFFSEFCEVFLTIKRMASNEYPFIVNMGTQMHAKFNKYWSMGNSLLAIACVLDPRCKLDVVQYYMEEMCPDECENFISNIKECMSELYNEYVQAKAEEQGAPDQNQPSMSKRNKSDVGASSMASDRKAGLKDYLKGRKGTTGTKTELEEYLSSDRDDANLDDDFDILSWWKMKAPRFPVLAQLTRDILAIPISTVASESAFSTSGRVLSQVRSSLSDESIEALLCAQDWLRVSIAETGKLIPAPLWTIEEEDINEEGQ
ncbi:Zinc finger BED domain-containing protein DAYSLEEPER [Rhynchospora pubera]|uniref:Zinc finger BED domain-containing protein DAYSLEEPER n=1 Tax=Rhynchospora pubera TaxID=906938 RepID=A0AAV8DS98_9POAL|nr:Zinc finger BED domain-containing protein DAYSLEEPER [Rhynchospora pubera]